jgi:hypothetical protein
MSTPRDHAKPRGIRNNNPGNIRHGDKWQGMRAEQTDPDFVQFNEPEDGIRALCKVLLTYFNGKPATNGRPAVPGINTVRQIIARWAPPSENDTGAYVASVARALRVEADQPIVLTDRAVMLPLVRAIIAHENGMSPYSAEQMNVGLSRAGIS